jgi:hypothetical protein
MNKEKKVMATPGEIEELFGIPKGTLANLRCQRKGPPFLKVGLRKVLYRLSDVESWIMKGEVKTSGYERTIATT